VQNSYYEILRVDPSSSDEDIKRAYKHLAKKFHPDMNPRNRQVAEIRFRVISEAYNAIKTRENRDRYNQQIRLKPDNANDNKSGFFAAFAGLFRAHPQDKQNRS